MPIFGGELPIGAGLLWYSATAPSSFLVCDGTSLSRVTYAKLFAIIGVTYGSVDANSFSLPDLRQRFPLGKAASGTGNALAGTGGAIDHAHTSPAHTHTVSAHYHGMGTGADLAVTNSPSGYSAWGGSVTTTAPKGDTSAGSYTAPTISGRIGLVTGGVDGNASMTSGSTAPSDTGTNNPPYIVVNYIIKFQ